MSEVLELALVFVCVCVVGCVGIGSSSSGRVNGVGTCVVGVAWPVWRRCTVVGAALICF